MARGCVDFSSPVVLTENSCKTADILNENITIYEENKSLREKHQFISIQIIFYQCQTLNDLFSHKHSTNF